MPFYNQSDVLYQRDEGTDTKEIISKFSVLKSPSILVEGESNRRESGDFALGKSGSVFDYKPTKLLFQDSNKKYLNDLPSASQPRS